MYKINDSVEPFSVGAFEYQFYIDINHPMRVYEPSDACTITITEYTNPLRALSKHFVGLGKVGDWPELRGQGPEH